MPNSNVAGVWKLRSYSRRFLDTGEVRDDMLPHAYILYTPGGYVMSLTVEADRQPPAGPVLTDQECIRLFKSIISGLMDAEGLAYNQRTKPRRFKRGCGAMKDATS